MKFLMCIQSVKNILRKERYSLSGIVIEFENDKSLKNNYVYIVINNVKKYFQIIEVSASTSSEYLLYKAIEFGSGEDKLSNIHNLNVGNFLHYKLIELDSKEAIIELEKRASYT